MTDTHETSADVIAAMRGGPIPQHRYDRELLRHFADRFEAAQERERGDAAKLREALSKFCAYSAVVLNTGMFNRVHLEALLNMAKAALAVPPRNCDRFGSSTQARAEWFKTEVLPRVEGVVSGVEPPLIDWLFAPATEKEGGAK